MKNHVVIFRSDLRFDGRVSAMIRTLSAAYPDDNIYLFELLRTNDYKLPDFADNVISKRPFILFNYLKIPLLSRLLCVFEFYLYAFVFLLVKQPKTIQVHYEITLFPALLYKLIFCKNKLVYNDQELYHYNDKNISRILFFIEYYTIRLSDLVIITNEYRKRALRYLLKNRIKKSLIVDNYVFEPFGEKLDIKVIDIISNLKQDGKKIMLHQGIISENRGESLLKSVVENLPNEWIVVFIGVSSELLEQFKSSLYIEAQDRLVNLGYIDYSQLNSIYQYIDAAILFYGSDTFNNKYCAPNRLYSAVNNGVPIMVNSDNVTLNEFVIANNNGISVSERSKIKEVDLFFVNYDLYKTNALKLKCKYQYDKVLYNVFEYYRNIDV